MFCLIFFDPINPGGGVEVEDREIGIVGGASETSSAIAGAASASDASSSSDAFGAFGAFGASVAVKLATTPPLSSRNSLVAF